MNVVDSSGWLEYFAAGPNAGFFAKPIEATVDLIVPTLSLYEVFKRVLQQRGEGEALQAVATMQQGAVVDLTASIALASAQTCVSQWPTASCWRLRVRGRPPCGARTLIFRISRRFATLPDARASCEQPGADLHPSTPIAVP